MRPLPAAKRMRLSPRGELRALARLAPELSQEVHQRLKEVVMEVTADQVVAAQIEVVNTNRGSISLDEETTAVLVSHAWEQVERELVDANAAYNATADDPHERALALYQALERATRYADVIYTLAPLPEEEDGE